jgi:hypothetical protein
MPVTGAQGRIVEVAEAQMPGSRLAEVHHSTTGVVSAVALGGGCPDAFLPHPHQLPMSEEVYSCPRA